MKLLYLWVLTCIFCCNQVLGHGSLFVGSRLLVHKKTNVRGKREAHIKSKPIESVEKSGKELAKKQSVILTVQQLAFSLGSMATSRKISRLDFKNKDILKYSRLVFCAYVFVSQLLYYVLVKLINSKNDTTIVDLPVQQNPVAAMTELLSSLSKDSAPGATAPKKQAVSVREYDLAETHKLFASALPEALLVTFMHFVLRWNGPLLQMPLMLLSSKLKSPVVLLNLFGLRPVGALQRPFKSMMDSFLAAIAPPPESSSGGSAAGDATDKVSVQQQGQEQRSAGESEVWEYPADVDSAATETDSEMEDGSEEHEEEQEEQEDTEGGEDGDGAEADSEEAQTDSEDSEEASDDVEEEELSEDDYDDILSEVQ